MSSDILNNEFGRAARRGKVDVLGLVLKKRIAQLRHVGQTELVFLVDSSASVGSDNFYNEVKFIRKVKLRTMNMDHSLNKPYVNGVTLREKNLS